MKEQTSSSISKMVKAAQLEAITNTYTEMLKKHPDQKKILDAILKVKLEALNR